MIFQFDSTLNVLKKTPTPNTYTLLNGESVQYPKFMIICTLIRYTCTLIVVDILRIYNYINVNVFIITSSRCHQWWALVYSSL